MLFAWYVILILQGWLKIYWCQGIGKWRSGIGNGDCGWDRCNHWKHQRFSRSSHCLKQKRISRRMKTCFVSCLAKHPMSQTDKWFSELCLFFVTNSKREHTSDGINLMTFMITNYDGVSQKLWCWNVSEVGDFHFHELLFTWSHFSDTVWILWI